MNAQDEIIELAEKFVKEQLQHDSSGHDWWHIHRVRQLAVRIAEKEGANPFICELAALLHDVADVKLNESKEAGIAKLENWAGHHVEDANVKDQILHIISTMSFNGGHNLPMTTLEGQIVQDADRLDALGAIGIARTFAYGGAKGRLMHDPESTPTEFTSEIEYRKNNGTSINHFYEKLLKLKDLMNTNYAKELAAHRHQFVEDYLNQFYDEWNSKEV